METVIPFQVVDVPEFVSRQRPSEMQILRTDSYPLVRQVCSPQDPGFPDLPSPQGHEANKDSWPFAQNPSLSYRFLPCGFPRSASSVTRGLPQQQEFNSFQDISASPLCWFLGHGRDDPAPKHFLHGHRSLLSSSVPFSWRAGRLRARSSERVTV